MEIFAFRVVSDKDLATKFVELLQLDWHWHFRHLLQLIEGSIVSDTLSTGATLACER